MRFLILFFILFPVLSHSFQLDWSGYFKANALYVKGDGTEMDAGVPFLFFNEQRLFLKSTARVSDGVSVRSNFLLGSVDRSAGNQTAFSDSSRRKVIFNSWKPLDIRLIPSHFYATYSNEFLQVDMGRQPFSFGLHMTYSDGFNPLSVVYDVRDALSVKVQYESFYLKPYAIIYNQNEINGTGASFAVAGGYGADKITAEFLYKSKNYVLQTPQNERVGFQPKPLIEAETLNLYGEYKEGPLSVSAEWGFMDNVDKSAGFGHVSWQTAFYNTSLNLIGGYISNGYDVNLNYDPTFTLWGYFYYVSGIEQAERIGPQHCFVLAPYITTNLTDKHTISLYHAWIADQDALNFKSHELSLITGHKIADGFSWYNKFGAVLQGASVSDFGIKTEAIISF
ncbi:MAG: hypothetical protein OXK80_04255 [Bdellovibrionales bacterium]|nr:hypothetical protein [Bdellovibrionales bacterium]